jgi:hypothetical protein
MHHRCGGRRLHHDTATCAATNIRDDRQHIHGHQMHLKRGRGVFKGSAGDTAIGWGDIALAYLMTETFDAREGQRHDRVSRH